MRNHKLVPTVSSSSKNNTKQEEPHLSGAYIRSLVKQLSSSSTARSKDHHHYSTMGTKPHGQPQEEEQQAAAAQTTPVEQQQQQPHKKQVRRRLHTSRPYQERLLNMAEARREIVTALKIHRASMRQAKEQQQQQQLLQLQQQQEVHHHQVVQEQSQTGSRVACTPMTMSPYASFSDYLYNSSPFSHLTATTSSSSTGSYFSPLQLPYHSSTPAVAPMQQADALDHLMLPLPTQPLGLNLSFQGFTSSSVNVGGVVDVDDACKNDITACSSLDPITPLLQPSPASSYSVYSSPSATMAGSNDYMSSSGAVTADQNSSSLAAAAAVASEASGQLQLHRALDDEEMAAIYSIGEQHDIEWSDTMNLVTSAWWSKLQDSVGIQGSTAVAQQQAAAVETMEDASKQYRQGDCFGDILGHHQGTMGGSGSDVVLAGVHHLGDYYGTEDVSWPR